MSTGKIFINYRKEDSNWNSLALYNELRKYFPSGLLFKDFNTIEPGDDFEESIQKALRSCEVLLVIIGRNWLSMNDNNGVKRLFDANDFVRLEISTALAEKKRVIPVLFDGVKMPAMEELPDDLRSLCKRQYYEISKERFDYDVQVLSDFIKKVLNQPGDSAGRLSKPAPAVGDEAIAQHEKKPKKISGIQETSDEHASLDPDIRKQSRRLNWIYIIASVLAIVWFVVYFTGVYAGGLIHLLLVMAVILILITIIISVKK